MKTYGFKIRNTVFNVKAKTEKLALKKLVDTEWDAIDDYGQVLLLGEEKSRKT